ncbi:MAG: hemolysin family protein [Chloracidobacterium sp.]|uniref:HlyC/CorC family transporter n=1 Tax=Chloracidobacterium validum TaxID=2821543 RepID=A0ABX8B5Y5_9BACT|nr:hemolysin family protein [Chloracidobacterium validum]QUW02378.1 HlyC/CorC family transporter [Chloracidobacterium validum]
MDDSVPIVVLKLLSVGLLVAANAFFVAAEFALVVVRRPRLLSLSAGGSRRAAVALRLLDDIDGTISATQFGITLASLALGWVGELTFSRIFESWLSAFIPGGLWLFVSAHALAVAVAFALITTLHIVFGELAPKSLALARSEQIALAVALPLAIFCRVFRPFIWLLDRAGSQTVRLFGVVPVRGGHHAAAYTQEEIQQLVALSHQSGHLKADEQELIRNVFHFSDTVVREVMVPRPEVISLPLKASSDEILQTLCESGYSRLPVHDAHPDNIVGFVHVKDILHRLVHKDTHQSALSVQEMLRRPVFIPDTAHLEEALRQLRAAQSPLGVVVDEHGTVEGIVTLEDILEQLVGDIRDEHDVTDEEVMVWHEPDGTLIFDGTIAIREVNRKFGLNLPESDDYATLAGFLMMQAGRLLDSGDVVRYNGYEFRVEQVERRRVARVRVTKLAESPVLPPVLLRQPSV